MSIYGHGNSYVLPSEDILVEVLSLFTVSEHKVRIYTCRDDCHVTESSQLVPAHSLLQTQSIKWPRISEENTPNSREELAACFLKLLRNA